MKVAIIGAGLIGNKRAQALDENDSLIIVCDINKDSAKKLANKFSANYTDNIYDIIRFDMIYYDRT